MELLSEGTRNMHRALVSLIEELEAVDWYQQRADACSDTELKAVLIHNKNEEIEHAMMTLEWLRRQSPEFGSNISKYIGTKGPITEVEEAAKATATAPAKASGAKSTSEVGSLGIGSLKPAPALHLVKGA
jgi:hypothetical protein